VAAAGFIKSAFLRYFSRPAHERILYRAIRRHKIGQIVELGVAKGVRAKRLIELAQRSAKGEVRYAGIDLFEARDPGQPGLTLKQAHCLLRATGAKVQAVPGDPFSALARVANSLTGTQLLIIAADQSGPALERAWFYVPRMLTENAIVYIETASDRGAVYQRLTVAEIANKSQAAQRNRRAA
jgi:hypothetical protein